MIAFQHFSLLSPGVFPGWPGPRPPGPTRFEVLNISLFCFLDDSREFSSSSSSSTASSGTTPTITSNRHGGQVPPHQDHDHGSHGMTCVLFQGWMGSGYNLDPAKIGQEGYNLLKYYEQQLKALQVGQTNNIIHALLCLNLSQAAYLFALFDNETNMQLNNWASILMLNKLGRVEHKSDEAVQRVQGGVDRQDQGGQERGQGKA